MALLELNKGVRSGMLGDCHAILELLQHMSLVSRPLSVICDFA
jgi:hypothetical protein